MARSVYSFLVAGSKRQPVLKAQNPINPELSNRRKRNVGYLIPPFRASKRRYYFIKSVHFTQLYKQHYAIYIMLFA